MNSGPTDRPILVTGTHRSGTTWVGAILAANDQVYKFHEPFNPDTSHSWIPKPDYWFPYPDSNPSIAEAVSNIVKLRPPVMSLLDKADSPRRKLGALRNAAGATSARVRHRRVLVKDPIALLAAEWLYLNYDFVPVVLVRHPAAFVCSVRQLGWDFDFTNLADQPRALAGPLRSFRQEIQQACQPTLHTPLECICLLWCVLNTVIYNYQQQYPQWVVCRFEDLVLAPIREFSALYDVLGLPWSDTVLTKIQSLRYDQRTPVESPGIVGVGPRSAHSAGWAWQCGLSNDDISLIRHLTISTWPLFYADSDWDQCQFT